ncbi:MAG: hypothetical protein WBF35_01665 [Candidatus Acidiferrales bacterium]
MDPADHGVKGGAVNTREKIVPAASLAARLKLSAAPDAKIVLASGRFDLISLDIVRELEAARIGNAFVVIVIDPKSGPDVLLPAEARAQLAAGLAAADLVVIAEPEELRVALPIAETLELKSDLAPRLLARFRGPSRA